jgi:hypothetical protein
MPPKQVKFDDAMKRNPNALKQLSTAVRKHGEWNDDIDEEKNIKTNYKSMSRENKKIIDEIFKQYGLKIVMVGNRNFTIVGDEGNISETVTHELTRFEQKEDPNTKQLIELEKKIQLLLDQRDPLVTKNQEMNMKIKELELERDKLKQARWDKWNEKVFNLLQSALTKVLDKPIEFVKAGIAIYLFYKVVVTVHYIANLFSEGINRMSNAWKGSDVKETVIATLNQTINGTNATNATITNTTNTTNTTIPIDELEDKDLTLSTAIATTMLFCAFGVVYLCTRSKKDKHQRILEALGEDNPEIAKVVVIAQSPQRTKTPHKSPAKPAVDERVSSSSDNDDEDEYTREDYEKALAFLKAEGRIS